MSSKFTECTLGQMYREVDARTGNILGRPDAVPPARARARCGFGRASVRVLAVIFAVMCIGGSFGGGQHVPSKPELRAGQRTCCHSSTGGWGSLAYGMSARAARWSASSSSAASSRIGQVAGFIVPVDVLASTSSAGFFIILTNADRNRSRASARSWARPLAPKAGLGGGFVGVSHGWVSDALRFRTKLASDRRRSPILPLRRMNRSARASSRCSSPSSTRSSCAP